MESKVVYKSIIKLLNSHDIDAWICGGTARDIYLGREPDGIDVAVKTDLATLQEKLQTKIVDVNEYSTCVYVKYKENTYTLYPLKKIELINTYYNYSFTNSLEEDSKTRDFTINALYYNPITDEWFDYQDSINDLKSKTLKFVGDPDLRILESKIRLIRAPILVAILGNDWNIDMKTRYAITEHAIKTAIINPRQINQELVKLFTRAKNPSTAFELMSQWELLEEFFPELKKCINIPQTNKTLGLDLFAHIMYALDSIEAIKPNALILRLTALLHDIGKPYTKIHTGTGLHFYNHENVGAYLSEKILYRWGFNRQTVNKVSWLIQHHLFDANPNRPEVSIKKFIQKVGVENVHDLLDMRIADRLGTGRSDISLENVYKLRDIINRIISEQNLENFRLNISDSDLETELSKYTDFLVETLPEVKLYLKHLILANNVKNDPSVLIKEVQALITTNCPLDKMHLFKTWTDIQTDSADVFADGRLKCGVFCNFICSAKQKNDN